MVVVKALKSLQCKLSQKIHNQFYNCLLMNEYMREKKTTSQGFEPKKVKKHIGKLC